MTYNTFKKVKILIISFISATIAASVSMDNIFLGLGGMFIGVLFLSLVRRKTKAIMNDERITTISTYAGRATYIIITVLLAFLSLIFILSGRKSSEPYIEALGVILSYTAMLSLAIYSISYKYFTRKYGAENDK